MKDILYLILNLYISQSAATMKPLVYNILSCIYAVFRVQYVFHFQNTAPVLHHSLLEWWGKEAKNEREGKGEEKKEKKLGPAFNPYSFPRCNTITNDKTLIFSSWNHTEKNP